MGAPATRARRYTRQQMPSDLKAACRAWATEVRAAEMAARGPALNARVVAAVRDLAPYRRARLVASYVAFGSEVDLAPLLADAGKRFAFPRVNARPAPHLTLHAAPAAGFAASAAWERHRFGQLEPGATLPEVEPAAVDLFLVPGLAFDVAGARLGYGKGYYDRLLPLAREGATLVGVTVDALVLPELPRLPHDVRVGYLVTESGWREALRVSSQEG